MTAVISGLGAWLPPERVTNADLCRELNTTEEWITTRTGIHERRRISPGMTVTDLATEAATRAVESAGAATIDAVVLATSSPERLGQAAAPGVAVRLGLGSLPAFDVVSACSGFMYGLATATGLIDAGIAGTVLLIGAEAFTTMVNGADRNTAPLFGDGAGALVLRRGDENELGAIGRFDLGSDGSRADLAAIPAGGSRQRSMSGGLGLDSVPAADWFLTMDGRALFVQAVERMSATALAALARASWSTDDVDCFVSHQANIRIGQAVAEEMDIPASRVPVNIDRTGNCLTASIPLLLTDAVASGQLKAGHRVLLAAFGGGLSWGATTLTWPDVPVTHAG
ncbi:3-oxoacyl-[acyl-carrier-protein] synthase 3 [Actinoplanes sp. NBRC 14428]|nr:3-oxoacyl-[acyl-carrier-protein] synthase 3 [Actinoplanes sp. NBRC 14428]